MLLQIYKAAEESNYIDGLIEFETMANQEDFCEEYADKIGIDHIKLPIFIRFQRLITHKNFPKMATTLKNQYQNILSYFDNNENNLKLCFQRSQNIRHKKLETPKQNNKDVNIQKALIKKAIDDNFFIKYFMSDINQLFKQFETRITTIITTKQKERSQYSEWDIAINLLKSVKELSVGTFHENNCINANLINEILGQLKKTKSDKMELISNDYQIMGFFLKEISLNKNKRDISINNTIFVETIIRKITNEDFTFDDFIKGFHNLQTNKTEKYTAFKKRLEEELKAHKIKQDKFEIDCYNFIKSYKIIPEEVGKWMKNYTNRKATPKEKEQIQNIAPIEAINIFKRMLESEEKKENTEDYNFYFLSFLKLVASLDISIATLNWLFFNNANIETIDLLKSDKNYAKKNRLSLYVKNLNTIQTMQNAEQIINDINAKPTINIIESVNFMDNQNLKINNSLQPQELDCLIVQELKKIYSNIITETEEAEEEINKKTVKDNQIMLGYYDLGKKYNSLFDVFLEHIYEKNKYFNDDTNQEIDIQKIQDEYIEKLKTFSNSITFLETICNLQYFYQCTESHIERAKMFEELKNNNIKILNYCDLKNKDMNNLSFFDLKNINDEKIKKIKRYILHMYYVIDTLDIYSIFSKTKWFAIDQLCGFIEYNKQKILNTMYETIAKYNTIKLQKIRKLKQIDNNLLTEIERDKILSKNAEYEKFLIEIKKQFNELIAQYKSLQKQPNNEYDQYNGINEYTIKNLEKYIKRNFVYAPEIVIAQQKTKIKNQTIDVFLSQCEELLDEDNFNEIVNFTQKEKLLDIFATTTDILYTGIQLYNLQLSSNNIEEITKFENTIKNLFPLMLKICEISRVITQETNNEEKPNVNFDQNNQNFLLIVSNIYKTLTLSSNKNNFFQELLSQALIRLEQNTEDIMSRIKYFKYNPLNDIYLNINIFKLFIEEPVTMTGPNNMKYMLSTDMHNIFQICNKYVLCNQALSAVTDFFKNNNDIPKTFILNLINYMQIILQNIFKIENQPDNKNVMNGLYNLANEVFNLISKLTVNYYNGLNIDEIIQELDRILQKEIEQPYTNKTIKQFIEFYNLKIKQYEEFKNHIQTECKDFLNDKSQVQRYINKIYGLKNLLEKFSGKQINTVIMSIDLNFLYNPVVFDAIIKVANYEKIYFNIFSILYNSICTHYGLNPQEFFDKIDDVEYLDEHQICLLYKINALKNAPTKELQQEKFKISIKSQLHCCIFVNVFKHIKKEKIKNISEYIFINNTQQKQYNNIDIVLNNPAFIEYRDIGTLNTSYALGRVDLDTNGFNKTMQNMEQFITSTKKCITNFAKQEMEKLQIADNESKKTNNQQEENNTLSVYTANTNHEEFKRKNKALDIIKQAQKQKKNIKEEKKDIEEKKQDNNYKEDQNKNN